MSLCQKLINLLKAVRKDPKAIHFLEPVLLYLFQNLGAEHHQETVKRIHLELPEGDTIILTIADKLREEGLIQGLEQGIKNSILKALQVKFDDIPAWLRERINAEHNPEVLEAIMEQGITAPSLQKFEVLMEDTPHSHVLNHVFRP